MFTGRGIKWFVLERAHIAGNSRLIFREVEVDIRNKHPHNHEIQDRSILPQSLIVPLGLEFSLCMVRGYV